jgi:hypothetical protein
MTSTRGQGSKLLLLPCIIVLPELMGVPARSRAVGLSCKCTEPPSGVSALRASIQLTRIDRPQTRPVF